MAMKELDFEVRSYSGGELDGAYGSVPRLVVECLELLLKKFMADGEAPAYSGDDPEVAELLKRLREG